jgi:hypothetical protein
MWFSIRGEVGFFGSRERMAYRRIADSFLPSDGQPAPYRSSSDSIGPEALADGLLTRVADNGWPAPVRCPMLPP